MDEVEMGASISSGIDRSLHHLHFSHQKELVVLLDSWCDLGRDQLSGRCIAFPWDVTLL